MSSTLWPVLAEVAFTVAAMRSVSNLPGSRLLMVTPLAARLLRATPATKPVSPLRAPLDRPSMSMGDFTALEVMFTMRPKPPRGHAVHRGLDELDGGEHVRVYRLDPGLAVPVAEIAGRRAARVGDHNVKVRAHGKYGLTAGHRGDVLGTKSTSAPVLSA